MRMAMKLLHFRRYRWIRVIVFFSVFVTFLGLLVTTDFHGRSRRPLPYPAVLDSLRSTDLRHLGGATYLDYTGSGIYSRAFIDAYEADLLTHFYPADHAISSWNVTARSVLGDIALELLHFFGADQAEYSVIFVASATQALKLIGENFPFESGSIFAYSSVNHNSVLGIRKYALAANATFSALRWPLDLDEILRLPASREAPNLLAFPFEENFAGTKPSPDTLRDLTRDPRVREKFFVLADVAAFVPTNPLNLSETPVDAAVLSFYKMFGYPNTGALVIRREFAERLPPVEPAPLQMNLAVHYGLAFLNGLGMANIQSHVWNMTVRLYKRLIRLKHSSGLPLCEVYGNHVAGKMELQGGVVAFNIIRNNGSFFGYSNVVKEASEANFHLRGGCHCNPGACFKAVEITEDRVKKYFDAKTTCGDSLDVIDGVPLGSVRASFGWATTEKEIDAFADWVRDNFAF
jgi:molybdenum cofactor sulfurtransferase